jgi:hypothetical protein
LDFLYVRTILTPSGVSLSFNNLQYTFTIPVPAGARRIIMHFAAQNPNRTVTATRADRLVRLQGSALVGLTRAEQNDIVNFFAFLNSDGDRLSDEDEVTLGTNPHHPDTDGDGLLDGFEVAYGFDPLTPGEETQDPDGDGLNNQAEQAAGTKFAIESHNHLSKCLACWPGVMLRSLHRQACDSVSLRKNGTYG